jgi:predicted GNAT family acetyltransferase
MKTKAYYAAILIGMVLSVASAKQGFGVDVNSKRVLALSGEWRYALDKNDVGVTQKWYDSLFVGRIVLPGTLDGAGIGNPNTLLPKLEKPQILHLTRKFSYVGPAWYVKEFVVPKDWANKELVLNLERVLWSSNVWVDGTFLGESKSLVAPHRYAISGLSAGKHRIAIRIDNRKQFDISVNDMAHAYTNETQVMWNGVIGDLSLQMKDRLSVKSISVFPDIEKKGVRVIVDVANETGKPVSGTVKFSALLKDTPVKATVEKFAISGNHGKIESFYSLGNDAALWNEFNPNVYTLSVALNSGKLSDKASTTFGMRKLSNENGYLQLNGTRIYLRGTLECCIFPLSGNPPMDKAGWQKVFGAAKQWGLNHLRFHSWCPPQAAFEVADEMGFYLQIELPLWSLTVGKDTATTHFLEHEAQRIVAEYGNHPSFCLWSMGNELEGDANILSSLMSSLKAQDPRHLYTTTTFSFQKGLGTAPQPNDDYFVTQWTNNGWIRGQGIFNSEPPSFDKSYSKPLQGVTVPVISHEIGQYSVYPNLKEIEKYTGSLIPLNLMAVKADLERKGLLHKADDFLHASGKLAAILYKEEIERALKTPEFSGFQLLDLHDFPGQGTALVGLLDAFWESKGIVTPNEFKAFCGPVVPLANFPKAVYLSSDTLRASAAIANFTGAPISQKRFTWTLSNGSNGVVASGAIDASSLAVGYTANLGKIEAPLLTISKAQQLTLKLGVEGTPYQNSWNIWVYPAHLAVNAGEVVVTTDVQAAQKALSEGRKVLFNPKWKEVKGIEGKFVPVFWSPVHFPKQAGTMGVLCNPSNPALANFPTEPFTDWQWWDLNINSTTVILDSISTVTPLVEMIDNFVNNRHLASIFEAKVGKGTLVFSSIDVASNLEKRPVARQLLYSLLSYMNGSSFNPQHELKPDELTKLTTTKTEENAKKKSEDIY